jgi:hypothetical protein
MYNYKTYRKFLPFMVTLHSAIGFYTSIRSNVKISINNDPKWLVITKVTLYSALWGASYPVTLPITVFVLYICKNK